MDNTNEIIKKMESIEKLIPKHNELMGILSNVSQDNYFLKKNKQEYDKLQVKLVKLFPHMSKQY